MSKKDIVKLVVFVVFLAVLSDVLWNVIRHTPATTVTATSVATATITATPTATNTTVPTATLTSFPTSVPTLEPTQVPGPSGTDWKLLLEFSGGPSVSIKASCYVNSLLDCVGEEVEIYLEGNQFNKVYLNGNYNSTSSWAIRLVPGHNRLVVPEANKIGIGNKTDISVRESNSTGYYLSCSPDSSGEGCVCTQFNDWTVIYQSPYGDFYQTTIQFQSEYSNTFFLNDMVKGKSIPIQSGDVLLLPKYDHETWDVSVLPFYGERPTPMPTRTPTIQP